MSRKISKVEAHRQAALELRVWARKTGQRVTRDMAYDAIAVAASNLERQGYEVPFLLSPTTVLQIARRELRLNGEYNLA